MEALEGLHAAPVVHRKLREKSGRMLTSTERGGQVHKWGFNAWEEVMGLGGCLGEVLGPAGRCPMRWF